MDKSRKRQTGQRPSSSNSPRPEGQERLDRKDVQDIQLEVKRTEQQATGRVTHDDDDKSIAQLDAQSAEVEEGLNGEKINNEKSAGANEMKQPASETGIQKAENDATLITDTEQQATDRVTHDDDDKSIAQKLDARLEQIEQERNEDKIKVKELEEKLEKLTTEMGKRLSETDTKKTDEAAKLRTEVENLNQLVEENKKQFAELRTNVESLRQKNQEHAVQFETRLSEMEGRQTEKKTVKTQVEGATVEQVQGWKAQIKDIEVKMEEMKREILNDEIIKKHQDELNNICTACMKMLQKFQHDEEEKLQQLINYNNKVLEDKDKKTASLLEQWLKQQDKANMERRNSLEIKITKSFEERLNNFAMRQNTALENKFEQMAAQDEQFDRKLQTIQTELSCKGNTQKQLTKKLNKVKSTYSKHDAAMNVLINSLSNSQREQFGKLEQTTLIRQHQLLQDIDGRFEQLKKDMVDGEILERTLENKISTGINEIRTELKYMEAKFSIFKSTLDASQKAETAKLEHQMREIDNVRRGRDAEILKEGDQKIDQLRLQLAGELGLCNKHMEECLHAGLIRLSGRLDIVESIQRRPPIGFTARTTGFTINTKSVVLKGFKEVMCNEGGHYNASTGVFMAPLAGMYIANLTHTQSDEGEIFLTLNHSRRSDTPISIKSLIASTWTYGKHSTSSDSAVVKMQEGDQLYVQVSHYCGSGQIWSPSSFSCFLIG